MIKLSLENNLSPYQLIYTKVKMILHNLIRFLDNPVICLKSLNLRVLLVSRKTGNHCLNRLF